MSSLKRKIEAEADKPAKKPLASFHKKFEEYIYDFRSSGKLLNVFKNNAVQKLNIKSVKQLFEIIEKGL